MRVLILVLGDEWYNGIRNDATRYGLINGGTYLFKNINQNLLAYLLPNGHTKCPCEFCQAIKREINNNIEVWVFWYQHVSVTIQSDWQVGTGEDTRNINPKVIAVLNGQDIQLEGNPNFWFDPLIIIFTFERAGGGWPEWDKAIEIVNKNKGKAYNFDSSGITEVKNQNPINRNNSPRIIEFKTGAYTVLFVKENDLEINNDGIDDLLDKILDNWGKGFNKDDIYVAIHDIKNYLKDKSKFENIVAYICDFHHSDSGINKEFCDELISFLEKINNDNSNEAVKTCEKIIELIKRLSMKDIIDLSILKHQIVNLLVPLRIDIEGLIDKDFEESYWEKVSKAWNENNIKAIFKNARAKIYDDKDTISGIIKERKISSKAWSIIQSVLPPQQINTSEEGEENLTGDEKVNKLLKALSSSDKNKKNKVRQILELHGNVYKQWMDKLINAIDQLKNELGQ